MYFFHLATRKKKPAPRKESFMEEKQSWTKRHGGALIAIVMVGLLLLTMLLNAN